MTDIDIQTAQLIIQLARDDLYGPDGSPNDESLSDLEFALAAQEQEFMQYWMNYGDAQVTPGNRTGVGITGSGMGNNVGSLGITTTSVQATPVPQPVPSTSSARPGPSFQSPANSSSSNAPFSFSTTGPFGQANLLLDEDEYEEESYPAPGPSTSTLSNLRLLAPLAPAQGATWERTHSTSSSASSGSPVDELPILEWTVNQVPAFGSQSIVREPLFEGEDYPPESPAAEWHPNLDDDEEPVPEWPTIMTPPVESPTTAEGPPLVDYVDYVQYTLQEPISPISSTGNSSDSESEEEPRNSLIPLFGRENSEDDAGRTSRVEIISRILEEYFRSGSFVEAVTPVEPSVECNFCKEQCPMSSALSTSCSHYVCRSCVTRNVELCTRDETAYPPKCCDNRLPSRDLINLLKDNSLIAKYESKFTEYSTPIRDRIYCCKCAEFLGSKATSTSGASSSSSFSSTLVSSAVLASPLVHQGMYCYRCLLYTCAACKQASHPYRPCQDTPSDIAFKQLTTEKGWQKCPNCDAVVELHVGCYHMKCRCATEFCYLCATRWKGCSCPNADEDRLLLAQ